MKKNNKSLTERDMMIADEEEMKSCSPVEVRKIEEDSNRK